MKTKLTLKTFALGGLILILVFGFTNFSLAQGGHGGRRGHLRQRFAQLQLTEEQQEELKTLIKNMHDQDADRQTIHEAVQAKLDEWGIERPEHPPRFGGQLTEEQKAEMKNLIQSMRDQDADRKDIHEAVKAKLKEWGFEPPKGGTRRRGFGLVGRGGRGGFWGKLSDDQKKVLNEKITELRNQDATREEIRAAVQELLKTWGIDPPQRGQGRQDRGKNRGERGDSTIGANNRPNPFNPETIINYTLENPEHVTIKIYNIQGQLIRTLTDTQKSVGTHHVRWNGRHDNGEVVSAGMYIYHIEAGKQILTGRMTLAK